MIFSCGNKGKVKKLEERIDDQYTEKRTDPRSNGEQIFKANCTACHTIGGGRLIGPDLEGITKKRKEDWLKQFINSASDFIASGDPDAIAIYEEYNKMAMTSFYFSDEDMEALLGYLENP